MSYLKICRICLNKGVKMYDYKQYYLKQYYEQVTAKKMDEYDGLPIYFCYECAATLHKFHKFKEKCYTGEKILHEMLWKGPITLKSISQIDRQKKNLQSTIDLIIITKRIKTFIVKHKPVKRNSIKRKNTKKREIIKTELGNDSENSIDNRNLAEIRHEIIIVNLNSIKNEIFDNETSMTIKENENISMENVSTETKESPDFEEDKRLSDDDISNTDCADDLKPTSEEENGNMILIDEEELSQMANEDSVKESHKKHRNKKVKKFVVSKTTYNDLDPDHWLKINLSEKEALEQFKAKAQDQKYVLAAFRCTDCYKHFSKEDMLNRHIKLRHCKSLGKIVCHFCKMRFKMRCNLTRHIKQHYNKYKCLRCDMMCPLLTTAVFHNDYHNGVIRKCKHCGEEFSTRNRRECMTRCMNVDEEKMACMDRSAYSVLSAYPHGKKHPSTYYTHLRTHRSEHVCNLCGASFVSALGLRMHKKTMHVNTVANVGEEREEVNTYCKLCDIKFETLKAYEEHMIHSAKHTEGVEDLAGETPGPSIPKRRRKLFKKHSISTPCAKCNITFPSYASFTKHHIAKHQGTRLPAQEQRYICEICGASLALNSVSAHLNTHTQEKLFHCPTCRMQFTTNSSMKRHQVTHTGEKPFKCTLCDKRFTQNTGVKLHYRTFHLKEPYPKRNRRKKTEIHQDLEDIRGVGGDNSEENLKLDRWR